MADEIAELVVKIRGDASDLEAAINSVTQELSSLEKAQNKSGGTNNSLAAYKNQMQQVEAAVQKSRNALSAAQKAYESNSASVSKNAEALRQQKSSIENLITAKNNEIKALEQANTVVNKGSAAYKDNQKAIQWTKTELSALQGEHKSVTAALQSQESELEKSKKAYHEASVAVEKATKKYAEYEKGLKSVQKAESAKNLQQTGKNMKELGSSLDTITKPIQNAALVTAAGGVAAAKFAIDFEDNFANVKKTVDGTDEELNALKQSIIDMSTSTGTGTDELTELAAIAGQLGIKTNNIAEFTDMMAKMGVATNLSGEEGASTLAKFANVTKMSQQDFGRLGSSIVDLGNHFATTEADIASMSMRLAGAGTQIGLNQADILGIATALSSVGIEAEMGGSAFSKAMIAMQMASKTGYDQINEVTQKTGMSLRELQLMSANDSMGFKGLADELGLTSTELNSMIKSGVQLENFGKITGRTAEEFKTLFDSNPSQAIDEFIKGLQNSDKAGESAIEMLQDMGFTEVRLRDSLLRLANSQAGVTDAVEMSNKAWEDNTALNEEFAKKQETTAQQIKIAKQNIIEAARSIGETFLPVIADASKGVANLAKKLANLGDGGKKVVVGIGASVIGLGMLTKVGVGTIKTVGGVIEAVGKIKGLLAGAGGSAIGGASATAAGEATAASAGTAATGISNFTAGLGSAASAAAPMAASLGVIIGAFGGTYAGAIKASEAIEKHREKLQGLGDEAQQAADKVREADKKITDTQNQNKDLDNYIAEYRALQNIIADGTADAQTEVEYKERLKVIEQWFIDNCGDYITAEEKKNGVRKESIDYLHDLSEAQKAAAEAEKAAAVAEARNTVSEGIEKAPEIVKNINEAQEKVNRYKQEAEDANKLSEQLSVLQNKYNQINNTMSGAERDAAIKKLQSDNQAVVDSYAKLTGGTLDYDNLSGAISNVAKTASDAADKVQKNAGDVQKYRESLEKFKDAAVLVVESDFGMTFSEAAQQDTEKLKEMQAELENFLRSLKILPDGQTIKINDDGSISYVEASVNELQGQLDELSKKKVEITLGANGKPLVATLDGVTYRLKEYDETTHTAKITLQDGTTYILNTATQKIIGFNDVNGEAVITANDQTADGVKSAQDSLEEVKDKEVTLKVVLKKILGEDTWNTLGGAFNKFIGYQPEYASGKSASDNYEGPAIVNDGTGPEAIEDKHGNVVIPAGSNVLTYVDRDDKVYTAEETRQMFDDIPHFAKGRKKKKTTTKKKKKEKPSNSEDFTAAKEEWEHYTKTNAVTVTQELEKWVEFSGKFKRNEKDAQDIEETLFSLMQKQSKELNDRSKKYLEDHTALNDWGDIGDDPIAAFERVRQRNIADVEAGRQTQQEMSDTMSSIGSQMYDDRIAMSEKWLSHEEKYNDLSAEDYLAGIDRMKAYTQQYYDAGMISYREYIEGMSELDDKYYDKQKERMEELKKERQETLDRQFDESKSYVDEHNYFNDWNDINDDPLSAYNRVREREWQAVLNGDRTEDEFHKTMSAFGSEMYSGRQEQSFQWLEEQRKYFGMTDEEYVQGLERMKTYTQQYYDQGLISRREYNEAMTELNHQSWDEAESAYEDMLKSQQDYISDMKEQFSKREQELQDSWTIEDRRTDMADVQRQLDIYSGAVTDRGQQKYKELQEQMKQLQREEELYQLQVSNNAAIERLEADYEELENGKAEYMRQIVANTNIDISGVVGTLTTNIQNTGNDVTNLLAQLLDKFDNFQIDAPSYTDNKQVIFNEADKATVMAILKENVGLDK